MKKEKVKEAISSEDIRKKEVKEISKRLWYIYGWFVLMIVAGIYAIRFPNTLGYCFVILGFFLFNITMFLYKIMILATKRILEGEEEIKHER